MNTTDAYNLHHKSLIGYLVKRGCDESTAEDIAQDAFTQLLTYPNTIHNVPAFLYTVATNLHRMRLRGKREEVWSGEDVPGDADLSAHLDNVATVERGMQVLNGKERKAITAVYLDGLGLPEAAALLGVPYGTLSMQMQRGIAKMRESLAKRA
jgi:RNA polymerase sigma factor (sigma-70 family)